MEKINSNCVNKETLDFISKLSFNGYILAGNAVANIFEEIPLQGDLDFWASEYKDFIRAFDEMSYYFNTFKMYPSMIEMIDTNGIFPNINLIYTNLPLDKIIERFDFPYCKCSFTLLNSKFKLTISKESKESISTKTIDVINPLKITYKRLLKAVKYGYKFKGNFWKYLHHLLVNKEFLINSDEEYLNITEEDLDLSQFDMVDIPTYISDKFNTSLTLLELKTQYEKCALTPNVKLPILLTFNFFEIDLLKEYMYLIIYNNPLSDVHYLDIKFGEFVVDYRERYYRYLCGEKESSSSSSNIEDDEEEEYPKVPSLLKIKKENKVIQLNASGTSYIYISYLPESLINYSNLQFNEMWNLHPKDKHRIIMYEKEVEVNRYSKSYLNTYTDLSHTKHSSYMYSGFDTSLNNEQLPPIFDSIFEYIKTKDSNYNQVIVNWYEDGEDYISQHSDCCRGMIEDYKICIVSFYSPLHPNKKEEEARTLKLLPKSFTISLKSEYNIPLTNGMILEMCGNTQEEFTHGINKERNKSKRISISFRQMKE